MSHPSQSSMSHLIHLFQLPYLIHLNTAHRKNQKGITLEHIPGYTEARTGGPKARPAATHHPHKSFELTLGRLSIRLRPYGC